MPKAYILVGVPGAGKSTWVQTQTLTKNYKYISTDRIVERYAAHVKKTYTEVFGLFMPRAVEEMSKQVIRAREKGQDIIWDQTSTTVASRSRKFRMLPEYEMIAVVFPTPEPAELERRLASRPGKEIPKEVVDNMIKNWEDPSEQEGFDKVIVIR